MKKTLWLVALLGIVALTLTGCNKNTPVENPVENQEENVEMANPASVYCEENGWTLNLEEWLCMFDDGSYCEEWSYYNNECQPGEIIYNTVSDEEIVEPTTPELYSEEDLATAEDVIMNRVNDWEVTVESFEVVYAGDEISTANLDYCKELANAKWKNVDECIVFTSSFYIPAQDTPMAGAFEPDTTITGYSWYLGRATAWEWEILTNGFG